MNLTNRSSSASGSSDGAELVAEAYGSLFIIIKYKTTTFRQYNRTTRVLPHVHTRTTPIPWS
jgi:hypothetical protein